VRQFIYNNGDSEAHINANVVARLPSRWNYNQTRIPLAFQDGGNLTPCCFVRKVCIFLLRLFFGCYLHISWTVLPVSMLLLYAILVFHIILQIMNVYERDGKDIFIRWKM
jgi:hypothetical protein